MSIKPTIAARIDLYARLRDGQAVDLHEGTRRTRRMYVLGSPSRSDGAFGSIESTGVTVAIAPGGGGGYSTRVTADSPYQHLTRAPTARPTHRQEKTMTTTEAPYLIGQSINVLFYGENGPQIAPLPITAITPATDGPGWVLTVTTPQGGREYPVDHAGASDFIFPTTASHAPKVDTNRGDR